jgi:hypothetical protein
MNLRFVLPFVAVVGASAQTTLTSTTTQRYFNGIRRNLEAAADVSRPKSTISG